MDDKDLTVSSVLIARDHAQIWSVTYSNEQVSNCYSLVIVRSIIVGFPADYEFKLGWKAILYIPALDVSDDFVTPNVTGCVEPNSEPVAVVSDFPKPIAVLPKENVLVVLEVDGAEVTLKEKSTFGWSDLCFVLDAFPNKFEVTGSATAAELGWSALVTTCWATVVAFISRVRSFSISSRWFL